jgi:hypothetical protein
MFLIDGDPVPLLDLRRLDITPAAADRHASA